MGGCSVLDCRSRGERSKEEGLSFHTFPSKAKFKNKWITATGRQNWKPLRYSRMCSKHFDEDSFVFMDKLCRLKPTAVPTKFVHVPQPKSCVIRKRERPNGRSDSKGKIHTRVTRASSQIVIKMDESISSVPNEEVLYECRSCLGMNDEDSSFPFFGPWPQAWDGMEATIAEDFEKITNVTLSDTGANPGHICRICYQRLLDACNFTYLARNSDALIRERLGISKDKTWPKPIKVVKTLDDMIFDNLMNKEIKEEVLSDEDNEFKLDQLKEPLTFDIKIEPEEFLTPLSDQNQHNGSQISLTGFDVIHDDHPETPPKAEVKVEKHSEDEQELPLDCMLCTKTFNSVTGLKAHVIAQHSYKTVKRKNGPTTSPVKKHKQKHVCATCRRTFHTSTDLMVHETCHNKDVCYGCNAKFDSFELLSKHRERCKAILSKTMVKPKTLEDVLRPQSNHSLDQSSVVQNNVSSSVDILSKNSPNPVETCGPIIKSDSLCSLSVSDIKINNVVSKNNLLNIEQVDVVCPLTKIEISNSPVVETNKTTDENISSAPLIEEVMFRNPLANEVDMCDELNDKGNVLSSLTNDMDLCSPTVKTEILNGPTEGDSPSIVEDNVFNPSTDEIDMCDNLDENKVISDKTSDILKYSKQINEIDEPTDIHIQINQVHSLAVEEDRVLCAGIK